MPPALDNDGHVIVDNYNNPLDATGKPVFALDEDHKPILDENDEPVPASVPEADE